MTNDETTTPTDEVETEQEAEVEQVEAEQTEGAAEVEQDEPVGQEAAKYRRRLREAEGRLAELSERLTGLQRAEVERLAAATLQKPAGLWAAGVELEALLDDAGQVDAEKVRAAARTAADALGLESKRGNYVPNEGALTAPPSGGSSWEAAFVPPAYRGL